MIASYSEYLKKKALLESGGDFSEQAVAKVQAALAEYEQKYLDGKTEDLPLSPEAGASAINQAAGLPSQEEVAQRLDHAPAAAPTGASYSQLLNPMSALVPKGQEDLPATGHPGGDMEAAQEWVRGDLSNPNGRVIVYDAPINVVRQKLAENPLMFNAMGLSVANPASVQKGDKVEQAYQDYLWSQTADAAVKSGKTPYRYSKAPWLGDGKGASILDSLQTKLGSAALPAAHSGQAFLMGVDDLGWFGAAQGAAKSGLLEPSETSKKFMTGPKPESKDEVVGGVPEDLTTAQRNAVVKEEHPAAYGAGALAGTFGPTPANRIFTGIAGAVPEGAGMVRRLVEPLARGGVAAGVDQAAREGVNAAANYAATGDTGTTLPDVGERIGEAAGMGVAAHLPMAASQGVGNWVREGQYFGGLPGEVERLNGGRVLPGVGHVTPEVVKQAELEARSRSIPVKPIDVLAERLDEPLTVAAKAHDQGTRIAVRQENQAFYASPEGRQRLPAQRTAEEALTQLRERTSSVNGAQTPVAVPNADRPVKGIFNSNIQGVSVKPREGWMKMSVPEAEAYLSPVWRKRALRAAEMPERPVMRPGTGLATVEEAGPLAARETPVGIQREEPVGALARRGEEPAPPLAPEGPKALAESNTRFSPEGPNWRKGNAPPEPEATNTAPTGGGPLVRGSRPRRPTEATARETGPQGEGPPKETQYSSNYEGPTGSRWKRRGEGEAPETGQQWQQDIKPGTFRQQLARRGVRSVWVQPREYDALHHEVAIAQLRRKGADTPNDRAMQKIYHSALQDRDARTLNGEPGGWSALQQKHEEAIRAAKDTRQRAAPKEGGAYGKVVGIANKSPGQSRDVRALEDTAARAGGNALENLRGARVMAPLDELRRRGGFGQTSGHKRWLFGLSAFGDAAMLRGIYPMTRPLEGAAGRAIGQLARPANQMVQDADEEDQRQQAAKPAAPPRKRPASSGRKREPIRRRGE